MSAAIASAATYTAQMIRNSQSPLKVLCAAADPEATGEPAVVVDFCWLSGAGTIPAPWVPRSLTPPEEVSTPWVSATSGKCLPSPAGTAVEVVIAGRTLPVLQGH